MTGIAANNYPEQYSFSGIGGWFGAELKFAGYDGFILEGKAQEPVYIAIDDDKVEFLSARNLWGKKSMIPRNGWRQPTAKNLRVW